MKKLRVIFLAFLAGCMFYISGGGSLLPEEAPVEITADGSDLAAEVPEFSGDSYVVVNDNQPDFEEEDFTEEEKKEYERIQNLMSITANWMNWDGVRRPRPISAKT